jgi:hypothetical protein
MDAGSAPLKNPGTTVFENLDQMQPARIPNNREHEFFD